MKKIIPLFLAVIMLITTGCSEKNPTKTESPPDISVKTVSPKTPSKVTSSKIVSTKTPGKATSSTPPTSSKKAKPIYYKKEEVKKLYAVDVNNYVMAEMKLSENENLLSDLETYKPDGTNPDGFAFLIFTDTKREYIYLDSSNSQFTSTCENDLERLPLHPSWLIHMTPEKIIAVNNYMGNPLKVPKNKKLDEKKEWLALSDYLKKEFIVTKSTSTHKGISNPLSSASFTLRLAFDTGTEYYMIGYDGSVAVDRFSGSPGVLYLYTSDLDTTIRYLLDAETSQKISAYIRRLTSTK